MASAASRAVGQVASLPFPDLAAFILIRAYRRRLRFFRFLRLFLLFSPDCSPVLLSVASAFWSVSAAGFRLESVAPFEAVSEEISCLGSSTTSASE